MRKPKTHTAAAALQMEAHSVARALTCGLELPLLAIRASVENLTHEFGRERRGAQRLDGVLRGVERLGRNVDGLVELAAPPTPRPLLCTSIEIVEAARAALSSEQRERVLSACSTGKQPMRVDGPLLAICLRRLIENSLEADSELVLVACSRSRFEAAFSVLDDAPTGLRSDWKPIPFHTSKPNHLGLGLTLTHRDVALIGGRMSFHATRSGATCVRITIPISTGTNR